MKTAPLQEREFDRRALLAAGAAAALTGALVKESSARAPSQPIEIAVIGVGGMGTNHVGRLAARNDCRLAYLCDVDSSRLEKGVEVARSASGSSPKTTRDLREVLADAAVQAVWIATPDHWHTPAAILALDAGKHVYVEKPCCHNLQEGEWLKQAVERSGKLLQVGTQSRSTPGVIEAIHRIRAGEIGDVLVAKAWNSQQRGSIGRERPSEPPKELDYETWLGPAPAVPYQNNLYRAWRWWHDFGCGDIGNDGVHDIDVALWGLGAKGYPTRMTCFGDKLFFDDDQQFPDTQYAVAEYADDTAPSGKRQMIFEQRIWSPYVQEGYENGAAFYGTKGQLILGHSSGWRLYGPRNKLIEEKTFPGADLDAHHTGFLRAVAGSAEGITANVDAGRFSAGFVHLANIAARVGRALEFDAKNLQIAGDDVATQMVRRAYREDHWSTPGKRVS